jgi:hypothetical protein
MSSSKPAVNSYPFHSKKCKNFGFIAFWSKSINEFVNKINDTSSHAHATHHDLLVKFVNNEYLGGTGELNHKKRVKGSKHDDLTISSDVIEFKFRSNRLESLPSVLKNRESIFKRNDYIYYSYFLERDRKDKTKILKIQNCIYYLIVIIFSRKIKPLNLKDLLNEVRQEEMAFTKEVALKSGVDLDEEELYAVGNMIKIRELERELEEKDKKLGEKDKKLGEKDKKLGEKDKKLGEKDKKLEEKDKEIERLKAQLKTK